MRSIVLTLTVMSTSELQLMMKCMLLCNIDNLCPAVRYGVSVMSRGKSDTCPPNTVVCDGHTDCQKGSDETICGPSQSNCNCRSKA